MNEMNAYKVLLLRKARVILQETHSESRNWHSFICNCLVTAQVQLWDYEGFNNLRKLSYASKALIKLISKRLEGHCTLDRWILEKHPGLIRKEDQSQFSGDVERGPSHARMYYTRLAWIDSLIEEFSPDPKWEKAQQDYYASGGLHPCYD